MEVTQFDPETGLLEVIIVKEKETCDDSDSLASCNLDIDSSQADVGNDASVESKDELSKSEIEIEEEVIAADLDSLPDVIQEEIPKIDDDTFEENKQQQADEMDCLYSIYGDDYGIVTDNSFIIKLSAGHFVVRLQVTYPESYPSHQPPDPLILGAYYNQFDLTAVMSDLIGLFSEGCTVVYEWTAHIQEYLQDLQDNFVSDLKKKEPKKFQEIIRFNRAQIETFLNSDDLSFSSNWVDSLDYKQRKKLWKLLRSKIDGDIKSILKKAKKICSGVNLKRLRAFCFWLSTEFEYREIPSTLKHSDKKSIKAVLYLKEVSESSKALITVENGRILLIGEHADRQLADDLLEVALLKTTIKTLFKNTQCSGSMFSQSDLHGKSLARENYYHLKKIDEYDLKTLCSLFSKKDLRTMCKDLQKAHQRQHTRQMKAQKALMLLQSRNINNPCARNSTSSHTLAQKLKSNKVHHFNEGHMFLQIGKHRGGKTVFHGTPARNALSILHQGLKVNGGKGAPANGAVYGRGIYTSPSVNIPMSYAGRQVLQYEGKNWLCVFEAKATSGKEVNNGIFLVPNEQNIKLVGLHLYRT